MIHYPDVDQIEAVAQAWPRLFAQPPAGLQPLTVDNGTLVVLCQTTGLVSFVIERHDDLLNSLNRALGGRIMITSITAVLATTTEMYLARELRALKAWLRDLDIGF